MTSNDIKTPSQLRAFVESAGQESHFFDRKTMRFFGDTMRNYWVARVRIVCDYDQHGTYFAEGVEREAFELGRRRPVKHGNRASAFFDAETFRQIFPKNSQE